MKLDKEQLRQIQQALLGAYDRNSMRIMVRLELNEDLDVIAGDDELGTVVFNLITWAERNNKIGELIHGALASVPGNVVLQQLVSDYHDWQGQGPPSSEQTVVGKLPIPSSRSPIPPPAVDVVEPASKPARGRVSTWIGVAILLSIAAAITILVVYRPLSPVATMPATEKASPSPTLPESATGSATTEPPSTAMPAEPTHVAQQVATAASPTTTVTLTITVPAQAITEEARVYLREGQAALAGSDWPLAIEKCTQAINSTHAITQTVEAYYCRGFAYDQQGENEAAIADFTALIALSSSDSSGLLINSPLVDLAFLERGLLNANVFDDCAKAVPDLERYLASEHSQYQSAARDALAMCSQ